MSFSASSRLSSARHEVEAPTPAPHAAVVPPPFATVLPLERQTPETVAAHGVNTSEASHGRRFYSGLAFYALQREQRTTHGRVTSSANTRRQRQQRGRFSVMGGDGVRVLTVTRHCRPLPPRPLAIGRAR